MHEDEQERRERFERLARDVYEPVQRYVRRRTVAADADDVFNDVLMTLWRRLDDVPLDDPLPWSYGVARRTLANHRRSDARRLRLVERVGAVATVTESEVDPPELDPLLAAALAELSASDRELLHLWAWEQLEPREIADVLGIGANVVSVRLWRARGRLESALARKDPGGAGQERGRPIQEHGS